MKRLTASEILDAADIKYVDVDVPEWGGTVRIAVMSGTARDAYEQQITSRRGKTDTVENLRALYLSYCLVDEDDKLLFSPADIARLGSKSGNVLSRLFSEATLLNALGIEGMEEQAKN